MRKFNFIVVYSKFTECLVCFRVAVRISATRNGGRYVLRVPRKYGGPTETEPERNVDGKIFNRRQNNERNRPSTRDRK